MILLHFLQADPQEFFFCVFAGFEWMFVRFIREVWAQFHTKHVKQANVVVVIGDAPPKTNMTMENYDFQ